MSGLIITRMLRPFGFDCKVPHLFTTDRATGEARGWKYSPIQDGWHHPAHDYSKMSNLEIGRRWGADS